MAYNNSAFRNEDSYEYKHFDLHSVKLDNNTNCYVAQPEFYAYYSSYDWVCFCWLFGRMIDLPAGFPMYCKDLKQELDEKQNNRYQLKKTIDETKALEKHEEHRLIYPLELKDHKDYPKQTNAHNALQDAIFNKNLHKFINSL